MPEPSQFAHIFGDRRPLPYWKCIQDFIPTDNPYGGHEGTKGGQAKESTPKPTHEWIVVKGKEKALVAFGVSEGVDGRILLTVLPVNARRINYDILFRSIGNPEETYLSALQ